MSLKYQNAAFEMEGGEGIITNKRIGLSSWII